MSNFAPSSFGSNGTGHSAERMGGDAFTEKGVYQRFVL